MRVLRKVLASLLVVAFALALVIALGLQVYRQTIANETFLKEAAHKGGLMAAEQAMIKQALGQQPQLAQANALGFDVQTITAAVVTNELLGAYNDVMLSAGVHILQGNTAALTVVDLTPLRNQASKVVQQMVSDRVKAVPDCKVGQIPAMAPSGTPTCVPPGQRAALVGAAQKEGEKIAASLVANLPGQIDLKAQLEQGGVDLQQISRPYRVAPAVWGIVAGLLVLLVLLNLDTTATPLGWIGGGALAAGTVVLAGGLFVKLAGTAVIMAQLSGGGSAVQPDVQAGQQVMVSFVSGLLQAVGSRVALAGGVAAGVGILCLVAMVRMRRQGDRTVQA